VIRVRPRSGASARRQHPRPARGYAVESGPELQGGDLDWGDSRRGAWRWNPSTSLRPPRGRSRPASRRFRALAAYAPGFAGVEAAGRRDAPRLPSRRIRLRRVRRGSRSGGGGGRINACGRCPRWKRTGHCPPSLPSRAARGDGGALAAALCALPERPWPHATPLDAARGVPPRRPSRGGEPCSRAGPLRALRDPFAVGLLDDLRRGAALQVARHIDRKAVARAAFPRPWVSFRVSRLGRTYLPDPNHLSPQAEDDLAEFTAAETRAFAVQLPTRSGGAGRPVEPR
jgi:hypothetical protein